MTNEQLVIEIQSGKTALISTLWEQVERFAYRQANKFYYGHLERCIAVGLEINDLEQEAFLGIHKAIEDYKTNKGVKFLTYAGYHLTKCFYSAAGLHRASKRQTAISLETPVTIHDNSNTVTIFDTLTDQSSEKELEKIIDREYLSQIKPILQKALDSLPATQKETAINCFGLSLTYAEYGRRRGVNRATISQSGNRALANLRAMPELMAYAY